MRVLGVLAFVGFALAQFIAACAGIDHHLGGVWAFLAVVVAFVFRFALPITIGAFFGARDVWHWHWAVALVFAAPGLLVAVPAMLSAMLTRMREPRTEGRDDLGSYSAEPLQVTPGPSTAADAPVVGTKSADERWAGPAPRSGWARIGAFLGVIAAVAVIAVVADTRTRHATDATYFPSPALSDPATTHSESSTAPPPSDSLAPDSVAPMTDLVAATSDPVELSSLQPVELGRLVEQLMMESGTEPTWAVLADGTGPVHWVTDGIDESSNRGGSERHGIARVTVDGKTTTVLHHTLQEVPWDVVITSTTPAKLGPQYVRIQPQNECFGSAGSGCDFDIEQSLAGAGVAMERLCDQRADGTGTRVYAVLAAGRSPAWLEYAGTAGSGGATTWVELYWRFQDISDDMRACLATSLSESTSPSAVGSDSSSEAIEPTHGELAPDVSPMESPAGAALKPATAAEAPSTATPDIESNGVGR